MNAIDPINNIPQPKNDLRRRRTPEIPVEVKIGAFPEILINPIIQDKERREWYA